MGIVTTTSIKKSWNSEAFRQNSPQTIDQCNRKALKELSTYFKPNVSIITPTMETRFSTLPLLWEWILRQDYPHDKIEWVIGTDTDEEKNYLKNNLRLGQTVESELR